MIPERADNPQNPCVGSSRKGKVKIGKLTRKGSSEEVGEEQKREEKREEEEDR